MSTTTRPKLTEQERAERRERDREYARRAVEQLRDSDGWQQWLRSRALFRTYSLGNQLLIAMQHPTAETVAGFRAWLKLGYCVQRGETSIRIWAPCPPTRKQIETWERNGSKPEERPRTFFKLSSVFAQDQVHELPPPAEPVALECPMRELEGDDLAEVLPGLTDLASEIGSTVKIARIAGRARGSTNLRPSGSRSSPRWPRTIRPRPSATNLHTHWSGQNAKTVTQCLSTRARS